jgi:hypothetical protein
MRVHGSEICDVRVFPNNFHSGQNGTGCCGDWILCWQTQLVHDFNLISSVAISGTYLQKNSGAAIARALTVCAIIVYFSLQVYWIDKKKLRNWISHT